jgi:hypothetical protein
MVGSGTVPEFRVTTTTMMHGLSHGSVNASPRQSGACVPPRGIDCSSVSVLRATAAFALAWGLACLSGCDDKPATAPSTRGDPAQLPPTAASLSDQRTISTYETEAGDEHSRSHESTHPQTHSQATADETNPSATPDSRRIGLRRADDRPDIDNARLAEVGILRFVSDRLVLYTDIDPEVARQLPPLIDAVYLQWIAYFGELPPAEDGSEFMLTGYLMRDRGLFQELGLLPEDLVEFQHGRHRGYQFWMNEQQYDYYRRHLLIHEATHCFMTIVPQRTPPPLFYLEGMAELFGTHTLLETGELRTGVMPASAEAAVGFGRIEMLRDAVRNGAGRTIAQVLEIDAQDFTESQSIPYAWSWALCWFLDSHPRYRERFRELAAIPDGDEFRRAMLDLFVDDRREMEAEWEVFVVGLEYGFDLERSAIDFVQGVPLAEGEPARIDLPADRGWESTGVLVEAGADYRVTCAGTVSLANSPQPWVSEPEGVTIRYAAGRPIGRVLAAIDSETSLAGGAQGHLTQSLDVGRSAVIHAEVDGTLYLRVNDYWSELADNVGSYGVLVERVAVSGALP